MLSFYEKTNTNAFVFPEYPDGAATQCLFGKDNLKRKRMELIDAGLMFNSPYPPLLRKQRSVDLILSFDFSARESDEERPFKVKKSLSLYLRCVCPVIDIGHLI